MADEEAPEGRFGLFEVSMTGEPSLWNWVLLRGDDDEQVAMSPYPMSKAAARKGVEWMIDHSNGLEWDTRINRSRRE